MTSKETARHLCLLALPALLFLLAGMFNGLREPLFHWSDPDYIYLLNALGVAEGAVPGHTDHPGTPLQVMGAVLLGGRHLATGRPFGSLREHVLREPEAFLSLWREVHRALAALALAAGGALVLRVTRSLPLALLFQVLPLLSVQVVVSMSIVAPEAVLMAMGTALAALTVAATCAPDRWRNRRTAAVLGAVAGIGIATKVVFAPVALVPWMALDRRGRRTFTLAVGAALAVALLPIAPRLPALAGWLFRLATHTGQYGTGSVGLIDASRLPLHLAILFREAWLTVALMVTAAVAGVRTLRRGPEEDHAAARVLVATAALQAAWLAVVLHHFDRRYLVPPALLDGLLVVLLWRLRPRAEGAVRSTRAVVAGLVGAAMALAPLRLADAAVTMKRVTRERTLLAGLVGRLSPLVEDSYVLSQPGALQLGNEFARYRFGADLHRLYPSFVSWHGGGIQAFGQGLPLTPLLRERPDGSKAVLALVRDHSPVVAVPPPPLRPVPLLRLGDHTLFEARLPP